MATRLTTFLALFPLIFHLLNFSSLAFSDPLSSSFARGQMRFWSDHVQNKMPEAISSKLSPLSKLDSDYYAKAILDTNFIAETKFCSLSRLACSGGIDRIDVDAKLYKIYGEELTKSLKAVDPFSFFRLSILKEENRIRLPNLKESLPYRAFLPPLIASRITLSLRGITKIFPESSMKAINTSLSHCNAPAIKGVLKACPKSLEEMIRFSKKVLGKPKLLALTSENTKGSGTELKIKKVKQFDVINIVACHDIFLPFASYFCHSLPSSKIYSVELVEPKTGIPVNTLLAICHMDTSAWPPNHVSLQILKFGPGQGEACHWFTEIDLAWIATG